ncbi:MAG TPA: Flp family type IVb pilin [Acetobacteraceae bacterium]|nr:Flp family type IVb pilin [Acetobacteraceae bacterium]
MPITTRLTVTKPFCNFRCGILSPQSAATCGQHKAHSYGTQQHISSGTGSLRPCSRTRIELTTDRRGVTSLEYALIGSIIVAAIVAGFTPLANTLSTLFAPIVAAL